MKVASQICPHWAHHVEVMDNWYMNAASQLYMADLGQRFQVSYMNLTYWMCTSRKQVCVTNTPYTPLLYSKSGVYRGIHIFLIFALKHKLWVIVKTALLRLF